MNVSHKFKLCWWLWACLSIPVIAYLLLRLHEAKDGIIYSDLGSMFYAIRHPEQAGWRYCLEPLFWDVLVPLVLAWVGQCLLVVGWDSWRQRHTVVHAAN